MSGSLYALLVVFLFQAGYAQTSTPVILISVDTLRADHLSSYQAGRRSTPHIDSLAKNGTLFSQASTPFPLTLPAHTALFTSTYAFANGVDDNGVPVQPAAVTLASVLKKSGYRTAAFVGSFILDRRFGLNQGFDLYEGPVDLHNNTTTMVERKRPGAQVAEAAMRWLEGNSSKPFFLFLHLYDLHLPYDLPQDPNLRHGETGYSAELAYEDKVLGDFLSFLDHKQLLQKALIVFTSDHGEGLGDHGESTHGYFIYQSTVHVPLIVHWPAGFKRAPHDRVDDPASLVDVAPTILDAVGVPSPAAMRGRSLIAVAAPKEVYSESLYARNHFGSASLRSLRAGNFKYIEAPKPELYDLSSDPKELKNLYEQQRPKATALSQQIAVVRRSSPVTRARAPSAPTPDTVAKLRSLGYLSGSSRSGRVESRLDPKDRIADFERYLRALDQGNAGKLRESSAELRSLRDKLPDIADIQISLALSQQRIGDFASAALEFKRGTEQAPLDALPHFELGFCYFRLGRSDEAIRELKAALTLQPWYSRADEALAEIYLQKKDFPQARNYLNQVLAIDPNSYTAHYNLGIFAAMEKNWPEAERRMTAAVRVDPGSAEAHETLGGIYVERGDLEKARQQLEEAIRLQPKRASAHYNLGMVFQKQGKSAEAEREFRAGQEAESSTKR